MDCPRCGGPIPESRLQGRQRSRVLYCSKECAQYFAKPDRPVPLSTGTVGALAEYIVGMHLLKHGWHVFRAMSPSAPCDLIATLNGSSYRVEVRSGYQNDKGIVTCPLGPKDIGKSDVLAVVVLDKDIHFFPDPFSGAGWDSLDRASRGLQRTLRAALEDTASRVSKGK